MENHRLLTDFSPNSFQQTTKLSILRIQDRTNPASSSRLRPLPATSKSTTSTPTTQSSQTPKARSQISSWSSWTSQALSPRTCKPIQQPQQAASGLPPPSVINWSSHRTTNLPFKFSLYLRPSCELVIYCSEVIDD